MKLSIYAVLAIVVSTAVLPIHAYADTFDVSGVWLTSDKSAHVQISDCGNATPCGVLVWLDVQAGDSPYDTENPNPDLRTRALIGMPFLTGFKRRGHKWVYGEIYDPETGKTYASKMRLKPDGTLSIKGCIGPFCQTQIWTPLDFDIEKPQP